MKNIKELKQEGKTQRQEKKIKNWKRKYTEFMDQIKVDELTQVGL